MLQTFHYSNKESNIIQYDEPRIYNQTDHETILKETFTCGFYSAELNRKKSTVESLNYYFSKECTFKEIEKSKDLNSLQNILNTIYPPMFIKINDLYFHFPLSPCSASRPEIKQLTLYLDKILRERCAMKKNLCPIRRELYKDTFTELIRQITVQGVERGLLLFRIRNETVRTLHSLSNLCQDSNVIGKGYSNKKNIRAILAKERYNDVVNKIKQLKEDISDKEAYLKKMTDIEESKLLNLIRQHKSIIQKIVTSNVQIKLQIESIKLKADQINLKHND